MRSLGYRERSQLRIEKRRIMTYHFIAAKSMEQAQGLYPGAALYVKYRKGYRAFDYLSDYYAFLAQHGEQIAA
jgi:hypothetical protein